MMINITLQSKNFRKVKVELELFQYPQLKTEERIHTIKQLMILTLIIQIIHKNLIDQI